MKKLWFVMLLAIGSLALAACGGQVQEAVEQAAPTIQAAAEELAPTIQAAAEELQPTVEAAVEELQPTIEAAVEELQPTVEAAIEEVAPTVEAAAEAAAGAAVNMLLGGECDETYEGETIIVYQSAGLTGPLSQILGDGFITGSQDGIDRINAEGGVCGVMLEARLEDSQYDPEQELAVYEQYRAEDPAPLFVLTYGSGAAIALKDRVIEDQIPNLTAGLNSEAFYIPRNGYTFGTGPIYPDQFGGFLQWASDNWADIKPADAGDEIVVGVIGWANSFGAGATTPEALAFAEELGITVLPLESQEVSPTTDVTGQLQNLLVSGANVIYVQSLSFGPAQVIGTLRALGGWDQVVVGGVNWSMNTDVVNILGENAALMDGYYGVMPNYWWNDTDQPGIQRALEDFEASELPETKKDIAYLLAYGEMLAIGNTLQQALNNVGLDGLSGAEFFNAMQELGTIDAGGIYSFNANGEDRAPREAQIRQAQATDGVVEFVVVEDFFELPDLRPPAE